PVSALRTPGSSATIRIEGMSVLSGSARQLDHEPRAVRRIVGNHDAAALLRDDSAHDRGAEPAAPLLGRIVWQKELLAIGERNARTVVGHRDADRATGR